MRNFVDRQMTSSKSSIHQEPKCEKSASGCETVRHSNKLRLSPLPCSSVLPLPPSPLTAPLRLVQFSVRSVFYPLTSLCLVQNLSRLRYIPRNALKKCSAAKTLIGNEESHRHVMRSDVKKYLLESRCRTIISGVLFPKSCLGATQPKVLA